MSAVILHSGLSKAANVAKCPSVSCSYSVPFFLMCVYGFVCVCVFHRWQRKGRVSWMGWWRELSAFPAALVALKARRSVCGHLHWQPLGPNSQLSFFLAAVAMATSASCSWFGDSATECLIYQKTIPLDLRTVTCPHEKNILKSDSG